MAINGKKYLKHWNCIIGALVLLLVSLMISGCAGTARGKSSSIYNHDQSLTAADNSNSVADAMVIIRFPAILDEGATRAYYRAFEQNVIGADYRSTAQTRRNTDQIAQSVIAKSNYYAMSLYHQLKQDLPAHSVLLSPHLVTLDDRNQLSSRPLLASEEIPSVVTIDFNVYSHPDPSKIMDSEPLTMGDIVTPLFVVHSNYWLRPSTHGLLLSSAPLMSSAWKQSEMEVQAQLDNRLEGTSPAYNRPLDFIGFLHDGPEKITGIPVKSRGQSRGDVIAVEQYPLEKIRMDGDVVAHLASDHSVDPFAEDFVKGASTRIVTALNRVDHDQATFLSRHQSLVRFDPELATAFLTRSGDEGVRSRLRMAESLLEAERKFLVAQSDSLYAGAYEGIYGGQMRQMIAGEYRLLEERRSLARTQNLSTALAILAMAGSVYAGSNGDSSNYYTTRTVSNVLMMSSLWAMNSAMSAHAESKIIGENFLMQMAPAIDHQVSVQLEWLNSREEITAHDFSEFRNKTLALYQQSVRSLEQGSYRQCEFMHPDMSVRGRWFGGCFGGLASGSGYGLILDPDGRSIEYVGSVESGMASGIGAMIVRSPNKIGAVFYEGDFRRGQPDGVVRVEEPGKKPRVRKFMAGFDSGAGEESRLQRLQF
jgi:hypothetical protein